METRGVGRLRKRAPSHRALSRAPLKVEGLHRHPKRDPLWGYDTYDSIDSITITTAWGPRVKGAFKCSMGATSGFFSSNSDEVWAGLARGYAACSIFIKTRAIRESDGNYSGFFI